MSWNPVLDPHCPLGDEVDAIGGSTFYSLIDTYETAKEERLLPIGLSKHAKIIKSVKKDMPITYDDVELHEPSTILDLRRLQDQWMAGEIGGSELVGIIDNLIKE